MASIPVGRALAAEGDAPSLPALGGPDLNQTSYRAAFTAFEEGDHDVARTLSEAGARAGDPAAAGLAGYLAIAGLGGPADLEQGAQWLALAASAGDLEAMVNLGRLGLSGEGGVSKDDGLNWLRSAAGANHPEAAAILGMAYLWGEGAPQSDAEAERYLGQAARAGHAAAAAEYGALIHHQGDSERAACWFLVSALGGDPEGMTLRALALALEDGAPRDFETAWAWIAERERRGALTAGDPQLVKLKAGLEGALSEEARRAAVLRPGGPEPAPATPCG